MKYRMIGLCLGIILLLAGCGGAEDPNSGVYYLSGAIVGTCNDV